MSAQSSAVTTACWRFLADQFESNWIGSTGQTSSSVEIIGLCETAWSTSSTSGLRSAEAQPSSMPTPAESGASTYAKARSADCMPRNAEGTRMPVPRPRVAQQSSWCWL